MNYTAATHLAASTGSNAGVGAMPWEMEPDPSGARQETWLLSFIDILALLLTLFVLLLAYQDRGLNQAAIETRSHAADAAPAFYPPAPVLYETTLATPLLPHPQDGFAMPGPGLLPLTPDTAGKKTVPDNGAAPDAVVQGAAVQHVAAQDVAVQDATAQDVAVQDTAVQDVAVQDAAVGDGDQARLTTDAVASTVAPVQFTSEDEHAAVTSANSVAEIASHQPPLAATVEQPAAVLSPDGFEHSAVDQLAATFRNSKLGERVEVTARPGAVSLEISDSILFAPASAALAAAGLTLLDELAEILRTLPYTLSVEGHTDNVPIHTARYPSNWELSAARAAMVTRQLIEQGVAPDRVHAVGYGDTRPRDENLSAEGRAKNRRVTFVLQVAAVPATFPENQASQ